MTKSSLAVPAGEGAPELAERGPSPWYLVAVVIVLTLLSYVDRAVLSLFAPAVQARFHISDSQLAVLFGLGFIVPLALMTLVIGWLIDRCNRVAIIAFGVLLWSVSTGLSGLAGSYPALLLARSGIGIGEACIGPAGYALIADRIPPARRGRAVGAVAAAVSVGTGAALIIGGLLLNVIQAHRPLPIFEDLAPWQTVYVLLGLVGIPGLLLLLPLRDARRTRFRVAGASGGIGRLLKTRKALFAAVFVGAAFNVATGTAVVSWAPTLMVRRFGVDAHSAGYLLGVMSIAGGLLGAPVAATLSDLWVRQKAPGGRLRAHPVLFGVIALGTLILATASTAALAAIGLFLITFSLGALNALSYAAMQDLSPQPLRGRMLAALQFVSLACGYGAGPSLVALCADHVFHDKASLGAAMLLVNIPLCILAAMAAWAGRFAYLDQMEQVEHAQAETSEIPTRAS